MGLRPGGPHQGNSLGKKNTKRRGSVSRAGEKLAASWNALGKHKGASPPEEAGHWIKRNLAFGRGQPPGIVVPSSSSRPARLLADMAYVSCYILLALTGVLAALQEPLLLRWFHTVVKTVMVALALVIYPAESKWRASSAAADVFFTCFMCMNGILELSRFPRSRSSGMMRDLLPRPERGVWRAPQSFSLRKRLWVFGILASRQSWALAVGRSACPPLVLPGVSPGTEGLQENARSCLYFWGADGMRYRNDGSGS